MVEVIYIAGAGIWMAVHGVLGVLLASAVTGRNKLDTIDLAIGWALSLAIPVVTGTVLVMLFGILQPWMVLTSTVLAVFFFIRWRVLTDGLEVLSIRISRNASLALILGLWVAGIRMIIRPDLGLFAAPDELGHLLSSMELRAGYWRTSGGDLEYMTVYGSNYPRGFHSLLIFWSILPFPVQIPVMLIPVICGPPIIMAFCAVLQRWSQSMWWIPTAFILMCYAAWAPMVETMWWVWKRNSLAISETLALALLLPAVFTVFSDRNRKVLPEEHVSLVVIGLAVGFVNPTTLMYWTMIILSGLLIRQGRWNTKREFIREPVFHTLVFSWFAFATWSIWWILFHPLEAAPESIGYVSNSLERSHFLIDIFTPRLAEGREWSQLLHVRNLCICIGLILTTAYILDDSDNRRQDLRGLLPPVIAAGILVIFHVPEESIATARGLIAGGPFILLATLAPILTMFDKVTEGGRLEHLLIAISPIVASVWKGWFFEYRTLTRPIWEYRTILSFGVVLSLALIVHAWGHFFEKWTFHGWRFVDHRVVVLGVLYLIFFLHQRWWPEVLRLAEIPWESICNVDSHSRDYCERFG